MTYNGDQTWTSLAGAASASAETLKEALIHGKDAYDEWQSFRAGRNNTMIAATLTTAERIVTEGMVAEMDACFGALKELHDAANNVAVSQLDRMYAMRVFS